MAGKNWIERDAAVVWHGFTQMERYPDNTPLIIERADGHDLIDVDGKRYLDAISSLWVTTLGHSGDAFRDPATTGFPGAAEFQAHIVGGIKSAMGLEPFCTRARGR